MENGSPTLLLTRPEAQSAEFLARCETRIGHRINAVISPVMDIVPTGEIPDLDRFQTVVVTSGNAVRALADVGISGRLVRTVGRRTAELACDFGADGEALGETADEFLNNAHDLKAPVLVCRGRHTRGDLPRSLAAVGMKVEEAIIYDQPARPLSRAALRLLEAPDPVVVPIFSPRSARLICQMATIHQDTRVIAISAATAADWTAPGLVELADAPTAEAMCACVIRAF